MVTLLTEVTEVTDVTEVGGEFDKDLIRQDGQTCLTKQNKCRRGAYVT